MRRRASECSAAASVARAVCRRVGSRPRRSPITACSHSPSKRATVTDGAVPSSGYLGISPTGEKRPYGARFSPPGGRFAPWSASCAVSNRGCSFSPKLTTTSEVLPGEGSSAGTARSRGVLRDEGDRRAIRHVHGRRQVRRRPPIGTLRWRWPLPAHRATSCTPLRRGRVRGAPGRGASRCRRLAASSSERRARHCVRAALRRAML